jgi:hypothetical protein|tara:strand:- start:1096 stop:1404 length:309 start_codon:yes stop_codon:yes gene_type:complete
MDTAAATSQYDIFFLCENNRVHPATLPAKVITVTAAADLTAWEAVEEARSQGQHIPKGSSRCGVIEVQTDEGIWTRTSCNRQGDSDFEFATWDDIDAADEAA